MRIFSGILVLIILISSCKKQELKEDISGLSGKWKASATCFYFGSGDYEEIYISDSLPTFRIRMRSISMEKNPHVSAISGKSAYE